MWNSDIDLIAAFKNADPCAFKKLYDDHFTLIFRLASKYLDNEKAEDVTQDVFFKLWEHKEKINDRPHAVRFLLMVCRHACINKIRHEKRKEKQMKELIAFAEMEDNLNSVEAQHAEIVEVQLTMLEKAVAKLPTPYRRIYDYAYRDERSNREISMLTGLSYQTVVNKKIIAIKLLRHSICERKIAHSLTLLIALCLQM